MPIMVSAQGECERVGWNEFGIGWAYSPQSSRTSGANASVSGDVEVTSSSAEHSPHRHTSPASGRRAKVTSAEHSGQVVVAAVGEVEGVVGVDIVDFLSILSSGTG
jgi:hypothetical protein